MTPRSITVWCQGGPADDWRYETLIEPPETIVVLPVPGPTRFARVLDASEDTTTYVRDRSVEQFSFERIYYPADGELWP